MTPPPAIYGHCMVTLFDRFILVFGGSSAVDTFYADIYILDVNVYRWFRPSVSGTRVSPRIHHTCVNVPSLNSIYVYGAYPERDPSVYVLRYQGQSVERLEWSVAVAVDEALGRVGDGQGRGLALPVPAIIAITVVSMVLVFSAAMFVIFRRRLARSRGKSPTPSDDLDLDTVPESQLQNHTQSQSQEQTQVQLHLGINLILRLNLRINRRLNFKLIPRPSLHQMHRIPNRPRI